MQFSNAKNTSIGAVAFSAKREPHHPGPMLEICILPHLPISHWLYPLKKPTPFNSPCPHMWHNFKLEEDDICTLNVNTVLYSFLSYLPVAWRLMCLFVLPLTGLVKSVIYSHNFLSWLRPHYFFSDTDHYRAHMYKNCPNTCPWPSCIMTAFIITRKFKYNFTF